MKMIAVLLGLFAAWQAPAPTPAALTSDPKGWVDLLADKSLKQWTRVSMSPVGQLPAGDVSGRRHGAVAPSGDLLVCEGDKAGHEMFRFAQEVGDFVLHVEWRYAGPPTDKPYNSGVFARTSADGCDLAPGADRRGRRIPVRRHAGGRQARARQPARQDGREPGQAGGRVERLRNPRVGQDD